MKGENLSLLHHELGDALAHVAATVSHTSGKVWTEDRGLPVRIARELQRQTGIFLIACVLVLPWPFP